MSGPMSGPMSDLRGPQGRGLACDRVCTAGERRAKMPFRTLPPTLALRLTHSLTASERLDTLHCFFADMGETVQYMTLVVAEGQVAREVIMLRGEDANENTQIARALVFTMAKAMANGIIVRNLTILRVRQEQDSDGRNMGRNWVGMARHVKPANGDVATLGPRLIDGDPSYGINLSAGGFHTLAYIFERKSHEARHRALQASPIFTFVTVDPLPTVPPEFHH